MKYPRIKPEKDRRRKLMPEDISAIKAMRREGMSCRQIGIRFGVSNSAILRLFFTEAQKAKWREYARKRAARKSKDPEWRKHHIETAAESLKYRRQVVPEYKQFERENSQNYHDRNPEMVRELDRAWRKAHPEKMHEKGVKRWKKVKSDPLLHDRQNKNLRAFYKRTHIVGACSVCGNPVTASSDSGKCIHCVQKNNIVCSVLGCGGKHCARGLCGKHYQRENKKRSRVPAQRKSQRQSATEDFA